MTKYRIDGVPFAYTDTSLETAVEQTAKQFGLLMEITAEQGGGGWPEVAIIGTAAQILKAFTTEGGWSTGDAEEDAEMVVAYMAEAKRLYGV